MHRCMVRTFVLMVVASLMAVSSLSGEPASPPAAPSPLPDASTLRDANTQVNDIFKNDLAGARKPEEKAALAEKILQVARETKRDLAGKYVLLGRARDLAVEAGATETAWSAVDEMAKSYQVDALKVKAETLAQLVKSVRTAEAYRGLVVKANGATDEAVAQDNYDLAKQIGETGVSAARLSKDSDLVMEASTRVQEIREIEAAFDQCKKAMGALVDNPKDANASVVAGRFMCFVKGDWSKGLPMLASGTDAKLKVLAEKELSKPTEGDKQAELADGWWEVGEKEKGASQRHTREHAAQWYEQALPNLTGLVRARIEKRLQTLEGRMHRELTLDLGNKVTMKLAPIPAGKFLMGSPDNEKGRSEDEGPRREVTIAEPFHMGVYEVTRGQFAQFIRDSGYKTDAEKDGKAWGWNGTRLAEMAGYSWRKTGFEQTDDHPVVNVSWSDAVAFCEWTSKKTGKKVSLPTEAQCEYACRAGTKTAYPWGDNPDDGNGWANAADQMAKGKFPASWPLFSWNDGYICTSPVGKFRANAFGLYDMIGNVWEWCYYEDAKRTDPQGPSSRTAGGLRGGSWYIVPQRCRSAYRGRNSPDLRGGDIGFRVNVDSK